MFRRMMHKKKLLGLLVIGFIVLFGCKRKSTNYSDSMPDDFNFISNIADNSYILDTYRNKLTKIIDWNLDTTVSYLLPIEEKLKIYNLLKEIDIYKYPENYAPTSTVDLSPTFSYCFKFTLNGIDHKVNWKENTESEIKEARQLRKLFLEIQNILEKDDLIIELPESKRAFY